MLNSEDNWIEETLPVEFISVDVGFLLTDGFYYGDQNDSTALLSGKWHTPLYKPRMTTWGSFVLIRSSDWSTEELVRYYKSVLTNIQKYRMDLSKCKQYFWMRPFLLYEHGVVSFPWYDTYSETNHLLTSIEEATVGEVFWDRDQGWELNMIAQEGRLYIREWDPDDSGSIPSVNMDCPLGTLQSQCTEIKLRVKRVLNDLETALGSNYWEHGADQKKDAAE